MPTGTQGWSKKDGLYSKALQGKRWPVTEKKHIGLQTRTKKIEPAMKRAAAQEEARKIWKGINTAKIRMQQENQHGFDIPDRLRICERSASAHDLLHNIASILATCQSAPFACGSCQSTLQDLAIVYFPACQSSLQDMAADSVICQTAGSR